MKVIPTAKTGRPPKDHLQMLNAMMWLAKSDAMREDLPKRYGLWKTVYSRFCKWQYEGVLNRIFESSDANRGIFLIQNREHQGSISS